MFNNSIFLDLQYSDTLMCSPYLITLYLCPFDTFVSYYHLLVKKFQMSITQSALTNVLHPICSVHLA
jgi:hypothetical protein